MFGINGAELVVLLLLAAVLVGPERLPGYAEQLAGWVRALRATVSGAKDRLSAELGEDDVDWAALDPRKYDPRRIVREALTEPSPYAPYAPHAPRAPRPRLRPGERAPFDDEAT